jgi:hypothetical protein
MPDDGSELARTIARAYRASGIAAKAHGGKLFIEREEGWEGPIEPTSARTTHTEDIRSIEGQVRRAASQVIEHLNETERQLMEQHPDGYASLFLSEPERFERLGYDDRRARLFVSVARYLSLWKDFQG